MASGLVCRASKAEHMAAPTNAANVKKALANWEPSNMMEGKINIDDLITHTMPLDKINDAFELMHEGKSIRSVVIY